ncbi:hypothetical protein PFISCL1PPCAC_7162 [Pristionchus fissidentatus]|uniref:Membrane protein BRI3 n=1 Tax=Pristionchus fissidentatus TaxID=1538716 RepID=A0AAV5VBC7_9BILA|nr:hypothetical protein PFISCL1PPCAC_7162 [Pristionchus fissidentatus]
MAALPEKQPPSDDHAPPYTPPQQPAYAPQQPMYPQMPPGEQAMGSQQPAYSYPQQPPQPQYAQAQYTQAPPTVVMAAPQPQVVVVGGTHATSCKSCGSPVVWERDQCCLIVVICVAIFCFPCGLFALFCMPPIRPKCVKCGSEDQCH